MCFASMGPLVSAGSSMLGGTDGGAAASGGGGYASLLPSVVSAIGGAATSGAAASGRRAVADYNATIAENNADLATLQAQDAVTRGRQSESDLYRQSGQLMGRQRANTAANGISLNEGSPAAIEASTRYMRDVDLATLRNNAARSAWGYNVQADNYRSQAKAYRAAADASSPTASVATSLLGSASGVSSKWYDLYKNAGGGKTATDDMPSGSSVFSSSGFFGD
ncbi:virion core protein, T7 gp14 family [Cupriavidus metallidurans]|uniref:virion core protein, T7 gp14 family n=1 Tax=Cupriavidus metallidurans TaxID=119219 RepID=UPI0035C704F2